MLPPHLPLTGVKIVRLVGNPPVNGVQVTASAEMEVFNGLALLDDDTANTAQVFTDYGIERKEGYVIYIDADNNPNLIKKSDLQNLKVYINADELHSEVPYANSGNQLVLSVKGIARKNAIRLSHIMLLCDV